MKIITPVVWQGMFPSESGLERHASFARPGLRLPEFVTCLGSMIYQPPESERSVRHRGNRRTMGFLDAAVAPIDSEEGDISCLDGFGGGGHSTPYDGPFGPSLLNLSSAKLRGENYVAV